MIYNKRMGREKISLWEYLSEVETDEVCSRDANHKGSIVNDYTRPATGHDEINGCEHTEFCAHTEGPTGPNHYEDGHGHYLSTESCKKQHLCNAFTDCTGIMNNGIGAVLSDSNQSCIDNHCYTEEAESHAAAVERAYYDRLWSEWRGRTGASHGVPGYVVATSTDYKRYFGNEGKANFPFIDADKHPCFTGSDRAAARVAAAEALLRQH